MNARQWLEQRLQLYQNQIFTADVVEKLCQLKISFEKIRDERKKVIFAGNGGSAAMASHCAVDFSKSVGIRSVNFNEADLITCLANDYGYEYWLEKALEMYADEGDLVILISSSGNSPNTIRAAEYANAQHLSLVTLTGFDRNNPLGKLGMLNFWVNSHSYNIVEMTHHIWLLSVCDLLISKTTDEKIVATVSTQLK